MRKAEIKYLDRTAGWLIEDEEGFRFLYYKAYLEFPDARPVSFSLPLQVEAYASRTMIPFFDGLIPEGWLLDIAARQWKLDPRDRMGLLMHCCRDCIGAVSVHPLILE
ncbi:MAG: phosphatidylinositol kinase [Chlorobium sp.]|nr:MAG: phosphatidylinositol kinase [Chlorobium sp.]